MSPTGVILVVGSLVGASCALLGVFLVLRRMALIGDAISHAVVPGIVIAFLLSGTRSPLPMVLGAGVFGVTTVFLVEILGKTKRLKEDSAIGVVFPALFALGVLLVSRYTSQIDLDLECVLYGEIAYAPWDLLLVGGRSIGPKALWVNGTILLLNAAFVWLFFKELKITTFDPPLAAALGFSPTILHYSLMTAVSITVVGAFESVGAILVVAMLVVPPAAAYLLTDRLGVMLSLAVALGVLAAIAGYGLARWWDVSIAGAMASVSGACFLVVFLGSPRHGVIARLLRQRRLGAATAEQLLLLHLGHAGPHASRGLLATRFSWRPGQLDRIVRSLRRRGWVEEAPEGLRLSAAGAQAIASSGQSPLRHREPEPALDPAP